MSDSVETTLRREEARGVFVIGLLAILLSLRLDQSFRAMFETLRPLNIVIVYWALYVGSAAIGVSSDIVDKAVANAMMEVAGMFFLIGAVTTVALGWSYATALLAFGRPMDWGSDFRMYGTGMLIGLLIKQSENLIVSIVKKRPIPRTRKVTWMWQTIVSITSILPIWFIPM